LDKENDILIYYNLWIGAKKELDYLQDLISNSIENQKTEIGKKALRQIIEDYNEWILGHKE
jgi:hypothetical protein